MTQNTLPEDKIATLAEAFTAYRTAVAQRAIAEDRLRSNRNAVAELISVLPARTNWSAYEATHEELKHVVRSAKQAEAEALDELRAAYDALIPVTVALSVEQHIRRVNVTVPLDFLLDRIRAEGYEPISISEYPSAVAGDDSYTLSLAFLAS